MKKFDCIKMKKQIQAQVYTETKDMSKAELLRYFNGVAKKPKPLRKAVKV